MKRILIILIMTALGLSLAYGVGINGQSYSGWPILFLCAVWAYALNWLVYIPAAIKQTEKFFDITGSFTYITGVGLAIILSENVDIRAIVVAALVVMWACRLGYFLFKRIKHDKKDRRFDKIKVDKLRFLITWTLQGCWVTLTALCALFILTANNQVAWDIFASVGLIMWVIGFFVEVAADNQKSRFNSNPDNKDKFISTGLWARSQHPNYFGEILLWSGIAVMALPLMSGWQYLALISPVFVAVLLTRVSGIPLLRRKSDAKWGDDPDYQAYRKSTPVLIPKVF